MNTKFPRAATSATTPRADFTTTASWRLQESGERGDYADLQWFYYYMERSDAMIHSVIQRRRAALLSLDWDIRIVSQSKDDPLAQEQADFLRMVYDNIDNFREAVSFLFTGFFRGFAHLEKHWTPGGLIERLEPVEQWFWIRDGLFGDWEYNAGAVSGCRRGESIKPEGEIRMKFLRHLSPILDFGRKCARPVVRHLFSARYLVFHRFEKPKI